MFGPGMHPGGFQLVPLLEYGVSNKQIELGTCVEQAQSIAIHTAHAVLTDDVTPYVVIGPNPGGEIA